MYGTDLRMTKIHERNPLHIRIHQSDIEEFPAMNQVSRRLHIQNTIFPDRNLPHGGFFHRHLRFDIRIRAQRIGRYIAYDFSQAIDDFDKDVLMTRPSSRLTLWDVSQSD